MSVKKNSDGTWYFSVRITDRYGRVKQIKRENRNWKLKRDAIDAERNFLNNHNVDFQTITYNDLFSSFIKHKSKKIKKRSLLTYSEVNSQHILPYFGEMFVGNITKEHIRKWQGDLLNKKFSNSYLKTIQSNFRRVLNWGFNNDLVVKNPFTIEYVKQEEQKREMQYFTINEFNQFLSVIENDVDKLIFSILFWCGVRKGEFQALTFKDVNFRNKTLTISKSYDNRNRIVTTPKNQTSYRDVVLPNFLATSLSSYINHCKKIAGYCEDLFLFGIDKPIPSTTLERKKNKYSKIAGVKQIRIHDFRHSHVSLMINEGISDFDIAKRLGHSRDMVNNVYGHWFKENQIKLADKLNKLHEVSVNS